MTSITATKSEKTVSTESNEPIKQAITIIEHKIRNLEKRKRKIESYREEQKNGKELNADQLNAVSKFDEVQLTLEFARDLCKQFNGLALDAAKQQKKQARKEAQERAHQEVEKVREILLVQDVLYNIENADSVREDFLEGRNGAIMVSEEELSYLHEISMAILPKRSKGEGLPSFADQTHTSAEHLIALIDGKTKDVVGTTYNKLKDLIHAIEACGYFDEHVEDEYVKCAENIVPLKVCSENSIISQHESVDNEKVVIVKSQTIIPQESHFNRAPLPPNAPSALLQIPATTILPSAVLPTTQPPPLSAVPAPGAQLLVQPTHIHHVPPPVHAVENPFYSSTSPPFVQPTIPQNRHLNEVIRSVSGHFSFLQDSELDSPDLSTLLSGGQGHASPQHVIVTQVSSNTTTVHPIPSQTYTNQNFVGVAGVTSPNLQHKVSFPSPEMSHIPGFATAASNPSTQMALSNSNPVTSVTQRPTNVHQIPPITQQMSSNAPITQHRSPLPPVSYVASAATVASQTFGAQVQTLPQALPLKVQPLTLPQQPQQQPQPLQQQQPQQIQHSPTLPHAVQPQLPQPPQSLAMLPHPQLLHALQQPQPQQSAPQPPQIQPMPQSPQSLTAQPQLQHVVQQQIQQRLPNVQSLPTLTQPVSPQLPGQQPIPAQQSSSQTLLAHSSSNQALPVQTQPLPAGFPTQKPAPEPPPEPEKTVEPPPSPPLDDKIDDWGACDVSQGDWSQQTELNSSDWCQQMVAVEWGECTTNESSTFPTEDHTRSSSKGSRGRGGRGGRGYNGYSGRGRRNYQNGRGGVGGGYGYRNDFRNNYNQSGGDQRGNFNGGGYKRGGRGRGGNPRGSERGGGNARGGGERGGSRPGMGRIGNNSRGNRPGNFMRNCNHNNDSDLKQQ